MDAHWHDWWIYEHDRENKTFHDLKVSGLLVVEWNYADDKMLIMVFDSETNVMLLWRIEDAAE